MKDQWGPHMPQTPGRVLRLYIDNKAPIKDYIMTTLSPYLMKIFRTWTTPYLK